MRFLKVDFRSEPLIESPEGSNTVQVSLDTNLGADPQVETFPTLGEAIQWVATELEQQQTLA
jgi:hypothetical protein